MSFLTKAKDTIVNGGHFTAISGNVNISAATADGGRAKNSTKLAIINLARILNTPQKIQPQTVSFFEQLS
jgi:hypothetical protein